MARGKGASLAGQRFLVTRYASPASVSWTFW